MMAPTESNTPTWPNGYRAAVSLTFDDARLSQVDRGLAILDRHGVKATFYVSLVTLEQRLDEWRAAVANGHELGNHTLTHPCSGNFEFVRPDHMLEDFTLARMERDMLDANDAIHAQVGVRPRTFAYPCGQTFIGRGAQQQSYVPLVAKHFLIGRGGFDEAPNDPYYCDPAMITGLELDGADWDYARQLIELAAAQGRWLVLFGHEVGQAGHQIVDGGTLDQLCQYCSDPDNGIWIDTVATIGRHVCALQQAGS